MRLQKKKINKSKQKKFLQHYQEVNIPYMCPFIMMMVPTNCHHYRIWNCLGDKTPETSLRDDFASRPACKGFINEVNWEGKKIYPKSVQHHFLGLGHGLHKKNEVNQPQVFSLLCIPPMNAMGPASSSPCYLSFPASKLKERLSLSFISYVALLSFISTHLLDLWHI